MSPSKLAWEEEDFHKWRPLFHLMPASGWLNDPCAPAYNPATGTYYVGFQWNPKGSSWGNISWGAATSRDLIHWIVSPVPSIEPSISNDPAGVFTGCMLPDHVTAACQDSLMMFYTSAQRGPIHFTRPYDWGSEALHAATSCDGGLTWSRVARTPVLPGPPKDLKVTGWRDPYVFKWPAYDKALGRTQNSGLYGIVAGGLRGNTPTIFLYSIDGDDVLEWTFLTTLLDTGLNSTMHSTSVDFGVNFEVANVMTLQDENNESHEVVIVGVEGCRLGTTNKVNSKHTTRAKRAGRAQKWLRGSLHHDKENDEQPKLKIDFEGSLDWGMFYAANSFYDPVSEAQIVHGWILEDDLNASLQERQGWSGCISFARSLSMKTYKNVVDVPTDLPGFGRKLESDGSLTLTTLACTPVEGLNTLRKVEIDMCSQGERQSSRGRRLSGSSMEWSGGISAFELEMCYEFSELAQGGCRVDLFHSKDLDTRTSIVYDQLQSQIIVDRHATTRDAPGIATGPEVAPFTLLSFREGTSKSVVREKLHIHIFYDVSVLEIFVNDRLAITTRVYPETGRCFGVWSRKLENNAKLSKCTLWELGYAEECDKDTVNVPIESYSNMMMTSDAP